MSPIRLVTFDMTGTLLKFRTPVMEQYAAAGAKYGIQADSNELGKHFKASWKKLGTEFPNFGRDSIGWQNWWTQIVLDTFSETKSTKSQKLEIAQQLVKHFETIEAWEVAPQGKSVLEELKQTKKKLGVISNFDPRLHTIMKHLKLTDYFSFVLTSYEVGFSKPDKRIFELAAKLGGVSSNQMCHIGNDRHLDFEAGIQAGCQAILLCDEPRGSFEVDSLKHVPSLIHFMDDLPASSS